MPKRFEYRNGNTIEYDIEAVKCPICGYMVAGYFHDGELVKVGLCVGCDIVEEGFQ